MAINQKQWTNLFRFCLGVFLGTAFCMKWMESDFVSQGQPFTIIGLEISYPAEKITAIMSGLDPRVHTILGYHLYFDFAFMVGVYPGIAALCMMAGSRLNKGGLRNGLLILAGLQLLGWACDIYENKCLLKWLNGRVAGDLSLYHWVVRIKWAIALSGALVSILVYLFSKKPK